MLKIFKISGEVKTDTAHMKISRTRNQSFDLHILIEHKNKLTAKIYCLSFAEERANTIKQDCIAELQREVPSAIICPTEIYFEGKLLFRLLPAK